MKPIRYNKNRPWAEDFTLVMQLGLTMAGCIAFCFWVGWELDKLLGIKGLFTIIFTLLGVAGGASVCYRQIQEFLNRPKPGGNGESQDEGTGNP
ncbi:MAG: AtpZ/AtpI family protein [Thermodesulfobacteriota bacterium]